MDDGREKLGSMNENILQILNAAFYNGEIIESKPLSLHQVMQKTLLNSTFLNPVVQKYPPKLGFLKIFLKTLIESLEKGHADVIDDWYELYCKFIKQSDTSKYCYKHYLIHGINKMITLKENCNMISDGTTGLCSWEAAIVLSQWCLFNKKVIENKNILELGSGVGLTGIILAKYCSIKKYCFTDCHEKVLETLTENVKINLDDDNNILIKNLNWENFDCSIPPLDAELILGSDIVFDPCLFEALCNVLKFLLSKNKRAYAVFVNTIRNDETQNLFTEFLSNKNFYFTHLSQPSPKELTWNNNNKYSILQIKLQC